MRLWSGGKARLSQLCKISAKALRYVLARPTRGHLNWDMEAYLLHPRCCRTEYYFEEHL